MSSLLDRLGRFCVRRRWWVLGAWLLVLVLAGGLASGLGGELNDNFKIPGSDAQTSVDILRAQFASQAGSDAELVFAAREGTLADPAARAEVEAVLTTTRGLEHVTDVSDPYAPQTPALSQDGRIGHAVVHYDAEPDVLGADGLEALQAAAASGDAVQVEVGGTLPMVNDNPETGPVEAIGIVAAIVILIIAFGSVVAMGLPMVTALVSLGTGIALITVTAAFADVPTVSPVLASMIGLGVGIDYALFIVTRHRQNLAHGHDIITSVGIANATAGQAVIFAGGTVVIAICGLWVTGVPPIGMMAVATAIVVATSVVAAVTLLPALLGFAGRNVTRFGIPGIKPPVEVGADSFWHRWADRVSNQPWRYLIGGLLLLLVLTIPLFSMRLGQEDAGTKPQTNSARRAYDLLAEGFGPGTNGPLLIVVDAATTPPEQRAAATEELSAALQETPGIVAVSPPMTNADGDTFVIPVVPSTSPQDAATAELVRTLRTDVIPAAVDDGTTAVYVGGTTATFIDLTERLADRLPVFIGAVVVLSFLLLTVVFRSPVVALKAAILNVLSIAAAYGVTVAAFQWGWGKGVIGLEEVVPIAPFVPMLMFAILFGLSMDYEVFILSRVREEYVRTGDNHGSVVTGLTATARVVTSAALIMIVVFCGFLLDVAPTVKMFGLGLAVAVLIDATVVRIVLVPATMSLLGDRNWWLPGWLDRILPRLDLEGIDAELAAADADADAAGLAAEGEGDRPLEPVS